LQRKQQEQQPRVGDGELLRYS